MPNMYDMLEALGAEYVGSILPYDTQILDDTQDGVLIQDMPNAYRHMLTPIVDYITSGDARDEQDIIDRFHDVTTVKAVEPTVTATLAQPVDVESEINSSSVTYTNSWTTRSRLLSGKESMWRRVRIK